MILISRAMKFSILTEKAILKPSLKIFKITMTDARNMVRQNS